MSIVGVPASSRRKIPNAPTIGVATNVGTSRPYNNGSATVAFTPSAIGFEATSYTVTSSPGSFTATGASSPLTVTGLQSNTAYTFTVTATSYLGTSSASAASNSITATTVPQAPTTGTATVATGQAYSGSANVGVSFTAGATGGSAITGYNVLSSSTNTAAGSVSPITISETVGTSRTYTVTASNVNGSSVASSATTAVTPASVPQAPTITSVTNVAGRPVNSPQATVAFTAGATGGSAITLYAATSSSGASSTWTQSPITVTETSSGSFTYTVTAANSQGTSVASTGSAVTLATIPSAPTIGTASNVIGIAYGSNPNIAVQFTANSQGGSAITAYKYSTDGGTTYATATGTTSPLNLTLQSTGIAFAAGTSYAVLLKAVNSSGDSLASAASNSAIASTKPQAPTVGTVTSASGQAYGATALVSVPFTAGATGGSAITSYTVEDIFGGILYSGVLTSPKVISVTTGNSSTFSVKAVNANGTSLSSGESTPGIIPATVPQAPTIGTLSRVTGIVNGANPQFNLTFTAGASGGSAITSYQYTTNGGTNWATATPTANTFNLTLQSTGVAFVAGTSYAVSIRAINAKGNSLASTASSSVVAATAPGAPTISLAATNAGLITVTYSYNTGGLSTTAYTSTTSPTITTTVGGTTTGSASGSYTLAASYAQAQAYSVTYAVTNAVGTSPNSNVPSVTPFPATAPSAPASLTAAVASTTSVTLTYGAITTNGAALTAWTGTGTSTGDITSTPAINLTYSGTPTAAGGTVTVTGTFAAATAYTFTLKARNSVGQGTGTTSTTGVTPLPLISDNFNRTTTGSLGTSSSGTSWVAQRGIWSTNGSVAVSTDAVSTYPMASVPLGSANATVSVNVSTLGGGTGVAFWVTDSGSWWAATTYYNQTSSNVYNACCSTTTVCSPSTYTINYAAATCSTTSTTTYSGTVGGSTSYRYCPGGEGQYSCNGTFFETQCYTLNYSCPSGQSYSGGYCYMDTFPYSITGSTPTCSGTYYTASIGYNCGSLNCSGAGTFTDGPYPGSSIGKSQSSCYCAKTTSTTSCTCAQGSPTNPSGPTSACTGTGSCAYPSCANCGGTTANVCNGCTETVFSQFYYLRMYSSVAGTVSNPVTDVNIGAQAAAIKVTTSGNTATAQAYSNTTMTTTLGAALTATNTGTKGTSHGIIKTVSDWGQGTSVDDFSTGI